MKKLVIAAAGLVAAFAVSASAADMTARPVVKAPTPVAAAAFSWTGLYFGGHVGGVWDAGAQGYSNPPFTNAGAAVAICASPAGVAPLTVPAGPNPFGLFVACGRIASVLGGGQIGYNWQNGAWVFGVEADGSWDIVRNRNYVRFGNNTTINAPMGSVAGDTAYLSSEQAGFGSLRGRMGYAPANWLLYATAGLAAGGVRHSFTEVLGVAACVTPGGTSCRTISDSTTRIGWTVGAGVEYGFTQNWSLGVEYLYVDLGRTTLSLPPVAGVSGVTTFFPNTSTATFDDRLHIARAKLNYRF